MLGLEGFVLPACHGDDGGGGVRGHDGDDDAVVDVLFWAACCLSG